MGNDGGSIPTRRELVKEAARNPTTTQIKESQYEQQDYYWSTDPLSRRPLAQPVVSDSSGKLYNKDSVLEHLLAAHEAEAKDSEAELILQGSVKSLKDVVEVKFTVADGENFGSVRREKWVCPITNDVLGPGSKAIYLVPCGHAFSGVAVKEVAENKCLTCDVPFAENDAISILPTSKEEIARLQVRIKTLKEQGLTHSLKKASKDKKKKKRLREDDHEGPVSEKPEASPGKSKSNGANGHGINNSSTRALTEKVMQHQEQRKKARHGNDNLDSLYSSRTRPVPSGKSCDFMTRGFDISAEGKR